MVIFMIVFVLGLCGNVMFLITICTKHEVNLLAAPLLYNLPCLYACPKGSKNMLPLEMKGRIFVMITLAVYNVLINLLCPFVLIQGGR